MCAMLESAGSFPNQGETEAWLAKKAPEGDPEDEDLEDDLEADDEDGVEDEWDDEDGVHVGRDDAGEPVAVLVVDEPRRLREARRLCEPRPSRRRKARRR